MSNNIGLYFYKHKICSRKLCSKPLRIIKKVQYIIYRKAWTWKKCFVITSEQWPACKFHYSQILIRLRLYGYTSKKKHLCYIIYKQGFSEIITLESLAYLLSNTFLRHEHSRKLTLWIACHYIINNFDRIVN